MRDGKRHGQGTYFAANGAFYEGEWRDSNRHGQGIMTWTSGSHYEGEFHRGKLHGNGICAWVNGDRYEGEWRYGERHSQGTYTWPGGNRYEGTWLSGIPARDGPDTMTLPTATASRTQSRRPRSQSSFSATTKEIGAPNSPALPGRSLARVGRPRPKR